MNKKSRRATVLVIAAAVLLPAGAAQAQWYSSVSRQPPPLYPYAAPAQQPYAVQVAPNTYVIHRPGEERPAPRQRARVRKQAAAVPAPVAKHRRSKVDPALVEELRQRVTKTSKVKSVTNKSAKSNSGDVINTTRYVHKKPIIRETVRYVDDPPRVVERRRYVDDPPARPGKKRAAAVDVTVGSRVINRDGKDGEKRVISADAEITILGPDRMTIQLYRKGGGPNAKAEALSN